jgi:hypothetical protein
MNWGINRLKGASIAPNVAEYEAIPSTSEQQYFKQIKPELFKFQAISIGDENGQAFIVPLDESGRGTAELILKALAAYKGE